MTTVQKIFFLILIFYTRDSVSEATQDMKDMTVEQLIHLAEQISQVRPNDVSASDIRFYLSTKNSPGKQIKLDETNSDLDTSKKTKILIHGWLENSKRTWYEKITEELLKSGDFNVVQVDWERVARSSYVSSAQNTKLVGSIIADMIMNKNMSLENVHLIGHSLGSHIAAFASKKIKSVTGKRVRRISGLDPAGPAFRELNVNESGRLNPQDADIVDAYHTDGGFYGYDKPIGTLDVFINGGRRVQPGCLDNISFVNVGDFIEKTFCSHAKSTLYFIDIINDNKFTCTKCDNWESFVAGKCNSNEKYVFGAEDVDESMTGSCYVNTSDRRSSRVFSFLENILKENTGFLKF